MENEKVKSWASTALLIIIILLSVFFIYHHREDLAKISSISIPFIGIISLLILIFIVLNGLIVKVIMGFFEICLPLKEWLGLTVITTMSNYFVPLKGGVSTRALYLKKKYNFQYAKFLASMAGTYVIYFGVIGFLGMATLFAYFGLYGKFYMKLFPIFLVVWCGSVFLSFLLKKSTRLRFRWKVVSSIFEGFSYFRNKRKKVLRLAILSTASCVVMALRLFFAFTALDIKVNFLHVLIVGLLSSLSIVLSLTPGNLGIKEAIITFSSHMLGYELTDGFLVAVIDRSLTLLVIFILGPIFSFVLLKTPKLAITPKEGVERK
ncbi:flippase-like domain-containing protein [candidate division KSB1 bacterium]|nr:flippase-like domain-containing protein [candidate division KSB1 bacterium]